MSYLYKGTGYLSDAVTTNTGKRSYLINVDGYQGSDNELGVPTGPVIERVPFIEGIAQSGETLTANVGLWLYDGTISYAYQWKRDNVDIVGATSATYTLVSADDNENISCEVTGTDPNASLSATTASVLILGLPLSLTAPVASGGLLIGDTLSVTEGTWRGVTPITFAYQWRRNAVAIVGATSETYVTVEDDFNENIDCLVTATNSFGSTSQDSNDIVPFVETAPTIVGLPTISGLVQVSETLTVTPASVEGFPIPTQTLQWQVSPNGSTLWADIVGETSTTYDITAADDGKYIRVVQTETNALGSDTAESASTVEVAGEIPVISGVPTFTGVESVGEVLTATAASVTGIPLPTTTLQWQRSANGLTGWADIAGATNAAYTLTTADGSEYVRVVQTSTNVLGTDTAESLPSGLILSLPVAQAATGVEATSFTANWDAYTDLTPNYYKLDVSTSADFSTFVLQNQTVFAPATSFEVTGLTPETQYYYRVKASDEYIGLLDDYSGAAAAYSLRQLSGSYSGDAIVVRRASDNATQSIGFVDNELDTASLESFCSGTDGFVTTWYDQSGNGNNVIQSTATQQPQIVSGGSTIVEGTKPAFDFLTGGNFIGATGYSFTDFAVFSVIHNDSTIGFPVSCQSNNSYGWRQHINNAFSFRSRFFGLNIDTSETPTQNYSLLSSFSYGNNGYTFVDGVQEATAAVNPSADTSANFEIGSALSAAADLYNGRMQEVVVYDSDQSANISGIHTNINDYYTIY